METRVVPIDRFRADRDLAEGEGSLLGLLFPTHGFTTPWLVIWFALRLPRMKGLDAVVVPTRAGTRFGPVCLPGMEGTAGWLVSLILALKGCRIRGVMGLDMPSNWLALHPGLGKKSVEIITGRAREKAGRFIGSFSAGIPVRRVRPAHPRSRTTPRIGGVSPDRQVLSLQALFRGQPVQRLRDVRRELPRARHPHVAAEPSAPLLDVLLRKLHALRRVLPGTRGPGRHSWGVVLYFVAANASLMAALNRLAPGLISSDILNGWTGTLIEYPFILLSLAISYAVFSLLVRIPPVNALFAWTTSPAFTAAPAIPKPASPICGEERTQPPEKTHRTPRNESIRHTRYDGPICCCSDEIAGTIKDRLTG